MPRRIQLSLLVLLAGCALVLKGRLENRAVTTAPPAVPVATAATFAQALRHYNLGFDNAIAGLLWIELLQRAEHTPVPDGAVSWEALQLDAITTLDPKFERAFPFGAAFLSVFRIDKLGAKRHLEKWVRYQPTSWRSHYQLGYHYYFELGDFDSAQRHVLRAAELPGAPPWLTALGVRLLSETGRLEQALRTAVELYVAYPAPEARQRLLRRIRALRYRTEQMAWEAALQKYRSRYRQEPADLRALAGEANIDSGRALASSFSPDDITTELADVLAERFHFRYDPTRRSIVATSAPDLANERLGVHRPRDGATEMSRP